MSLTKQKTLKKVEFIFTENELNPKCHVVYENKIIENNEVIFSKNHRETVDTSKIKEIITNCKIYNLQKNETP